MMSSILKKKPAWLEARTKQASNALSPTSQQPSTAPPKSSSGVDLFRRSNGSFSYREERLREKRDKEERKKQRSEKKRKKREQQAGDKDSSEEGSGSDESAGVESKRRCSDRRVSASDSAKPVKLVKAEQDSPREPKWTKGTSGLGDPVKDTVEIDDSEALKKPLKHNLEAIDNAEIKPATSATPPSDKNDSESASNSDAEFQRLVRRAEARKRLQANGANAVSPTSVGRKRSVPLDSNGRTVSPNNDSKQSSGSYPTPISPSTEPGQTSEPIISILVHSSLPDTRPVIFRVKHSQKLRMVKESFCKRWNLPDHIARNIYLTWRSLKIFDTTTCSSLGIEVDPITRAVTWRGPSGRGRMDGSDQLVMEAWTPELFKQEKQKEMDKQRDRDHEVEKDNLDTVQAEERERRREEREKSAIRIILHAKGLEEERLTVYPVSAMRL